MAAQGLEEFGSPFYWGMKWKVQIHNRLQKESGSRFTMHPLDGAIIAYLVSISPGDHFEIGMLQGGSSILAAMAKNAFGQTGHIYGCDPFGWADGQTQRGPEPSVSTVLMNAELFDVADRITPFQHAHPPLPPELEGRRFDTCFIDGAHDYNSALADWQHAKEYTDRYVLFHDIHKTDPEHGARLVFEEACDEPDWEHFYEDAKMGVVRKCT